MEREVEGMKIYGDLGDPGGGEPEWNLGGILISLSLILGVTLPNS